MDKENIEERISALKLELKHYNQEIISHVEVLNSQNFKNLKIDLKNDPRNAVRSFPFLSRQIAVATPSIQALSSNR